MPLTYSGNLNLKFSASYICGGPLKCGGPGQLPTLPMLKSGPAMWRDFFIIEKRGDYYNFLFDQNLPKQVRSWPVEVFQEHNFTELSFALTLLIADFYQLWKSFCKNPEHIHRKNQCPGKTGASSAPEPENQNTEHLRRLKGQEDQKPKRNNYLGGPNA